MYSFVSFSRYNIKFPSRDRSPLFLRFETRSQVLLHISDAAPRNNVATTWHEIGCGGQPSEEFCIGTKMGGWKSRHWLCAQDNWHDAGVLSWDSKDWKSSNVRFSTPLVSFWTVMQNFPHLLLFIPQSPYKLPPKNKFFSALLWLYTLLCEWAPVSPLMSWQQVSPLAHLLLPSVMRPSIVWLNLELIGLQL